MTEAALASPTVSLCMIVKNEADNLLRCLTSAQSQVDEMIVVDTGSEDDTMAIARALGATVSQFAWCNDFASARNFALAQATGDWILVLDADEELVVESQSLQDFLRTQSTAIAHYIALNDAEYEHALTPLMTLRLFRNSPDIRYASRFHEQLRYNGKPFMEGQLGYCPVLRIVHYGYTNELLHQKHLHRNIPILESIRQQEDLSLMLLATLAGIYEETGETEKAQACFAEAFERLLPNLMTGTPPEKFGFVPNLLHTLGAQAFDAEDYETVQLICQRGLEWCPNFPPLNYLTGDLLKMLGFSLGAIAYYEFCLQMGQAGTYYRGERFDQSFMKAYPAYSLGCIYQEMGRSQNARAAFEQALSFDPHFELAQQRLEYLTAEQRSS